MDAKEVRLGNWYLQDGKPVKVSEIRHWYFGEDDPIPLTPEILEANHFNVAGDPELKGIVYEITGKPGYWEYMGVEIEFVHQLQNVYYINHKFTEVEIKIN